MSVPVKLFILGLLARKERHGYEISSTAKSWGVNGWAGFGPGSLYHALAALEKSGDIVQRRTEQQGRYPVRSIYAITRQGRDTVGRLLVQASQDAGFEDPIDLVLGFLPILPPQDRRQLLELRINSLVAAREEIERQARRLGEAGVDPWTLASLDRRILVGQAQIQWLGRLLDEVSTWKAPDR